MDMSIEEKEELATKEEKKSRFQVLKETKISIPKLATWITITILLLAIFTFILTPKYPRPTPDTGFKWAYKFSKGYVFVFAYDIEKGMMFVDEYDYVYSNIDLYFLVKQNGTYTVTLLLLNKVNATYYDVTSNITQQIELEFFEFSKININMPKIDKMLIAKLLINGEEITQFYYRYNVLYQEIRTSLGDMLLSQVIYLIIGFVIMLMGMFIAKGISNSYPTPEPDLRMAGYFFAIAGFILYITTKDLVVVYGLTNAMIVYIPFLVISILAGFYVVGEHSKEFLFIRVSLDTTTCETIAIKARKIGTLYYKTPNLYEFLLYKPTAITWDKLEFIFKDTGDYDYLVYFDTIEEKKDRMEIKISDIHRLRIEEYKSDIRKVHAFSKTIEELRAKVETLVIKLEKGEFERDLGFLSQLIGDEVYEPKEE